MKSRTGSSRALLGMTVLALTSVAVHAQTSADLVKSIRPVTDEMLRNPPAATG